MLTCKTDFEEARNRINAFWQCEVIDRALTYIMFPRPEEKQVPVPPRPEKPEQRKLDVDYRVRAADARMHNTVWYADAIPVATPTLGPATVASYFGIGLGFAEGTGSSWATHDIREWPEDTSTILNFDPDGFYYRKTIELTRAFREAGKGRFITGIQEWLSPGDILSAARGPEQLCVDLMDCPERITSLCDRLSRALLPIYETFYRMARDAGEPASTWLNLISDGRYMVIQNDVSSLLSPAMFDEFLLPYTRRECEYLDHSMYHLDGLQALKDLDRLLEIPELNAVQWGPPPQHWDWHEWIDVYKRIQSAGKGFFLPVPAKDLDELSDSGIRPEGAWIIVEGVLNEEEAAAALKLVERWT
ncbi:MAG: uroporphyrinogen decarboxylase family protein [Kiritimatiellia bacterium]